MVSAAFRTCLACGKPIKGRADKKFCDDYCRNNYNNRLNSDATLMIRNVNNALRKNRRILAEVISSAEKPVTISKQHLLDKGFDFQYITHIHTSNAGKIYNCCYDFAYLPLKEKDLFQVIKV